MPISITENKDCMIAMKEFPDKFFDLAIVDPPYGIKQDGASNNSRGSLRKDGTKRQGGSFGAKATQFTPKKWDEKPPDKNYFKELMRVSKNQIIWGANHFVENIPNANSPCWVIWDKLNGDTDFADCEIAWCSLNKAIRKFSYKYQGALVGDMKNKEKRIHPTQKPIHLYSWLLTNYAKSGNKILDTHLGSGSSRIAAFNAGFDFWGYEIDAEYFEAQEKRFNGGSDTLSSIIYKQTNIFDE